MSRLLIWMTLSLLGLLISTRTRSASLALPLSLFVWVLLVLVLPKFSCLVSEQLMEVPTAQELEREMIAIRHNADNELYDKLLD